LQIARGRMGDEPIVRAARRPRINAFDIHVIEPSEGLRQVRRGSAGLIVTVPSSSTCTTNRPGSAPRLKRRRPLTFRKMIACVGAPFDRKSLGHLLLEERVKACLTCARRVNLAACHLELQVSHAQQRADYLSRPGVMKEST
jgi:hypothetical protein